VSNESKEKPRFASRLTILVSLLIIGGCATTSTVQQINKLESVGESPTIALMPPDIRYYLLTAGGVPEPNAEWTDAAQTNFVAATLNYAANSIRFGTSQLTPTTTANTAQWETES